MLSFGPHHQQAASAHTHLQAVEAAAVVDLQEGPRARTSLAPRLHPAANPERLPNLFALCVSNTDSLGQPSGAS
jgi:hypothetical protein